MDKGRSYRSFGKWILGGEHSVLRGSRALVFPLMSLDLSLTHFDDDSDFSAEFSGSTGAQYQLIFYGLFDRALEMLGRPRGAVKGHVLFNSNLPLGNGLGASAALCVAVGRWFSDLGWVEKDQLNKFCRDLENIFHGESSGVDVAVVLSEQPIIFEMNKGAIPFEPSWRPPFFLSSSGEKGLTHSCVEKVKTFIHGDAERGRRLDQQMSKSVELMRGLLSSPESANSLESLSEALRMSKDCFEQWGLTEGGLQREMNRLLAAGALAVKPTGSGGGGFVLSLWENAPPSAVASSLISAW